MAAKDYRKFMRYCNVVQDRTSPNYLRHVIETRSMRCSKCNALMWLSERLKSSSLKSPKFSLCCLSGSIKIPNVDPIPDKLRELLTGSDQKSEYFRTNIRMFNSILSFTSMNCKLDKELMKATTGVYTFRISGSIHHSISESMTTSSPKFSQIYILDGDAQIAHREQMFPFVQANILRELQIMLAHENPYVQIYHQIGHQLKHEPNKQLKLVLKNNYKRDKRFNLPSANELAILMIDDENQENVHRDIVLYSKSPNESRLIRINETHSTYDPLHYVLLFPKGQQGWSPDTYEKNKHLAAQNDSEDEEVQSEKTKYLTAMQFYSHRLQDRPGIRVICFLFYK